MKLKRETAAAPADILNSAEALIDFCRDNEARLVAFAVQIWPRVRIAREPARLRFYVQGEKAGPSFVIELEPHPILKAA